MKKWGALLVLSLSMFIIVIDTTIMNVSISALAQDLNTTIEGVQSAISLYALTMAALMLTSGKLADILGKKKTFYIGVAFYGLGTLTASIAQSLGMLIIGWSIIEGIGGALMLPTVQNLIRDNYKGKDRAFGYGIMGGVAASGAALGPLIGGYLTSYYTWRWAFRLEFLIVIIVILLAGYIKKDKRAQARPHFDVGGALLSGFGMTLVVLGILLVSSYGLILADQPLMIAGQTINLLGFSPAGILLAAGILTIMTFFNYESSRISQKKDVLIDPEILKITNFKNGLYTRFFQYLAQAALLYSLPLFMQTYLGLDAFNTGLSLMPLSLAIVASSIIGSKLTDKYIPKKLINFGFIIAIVGCISFILTSQPYMQVNQLYLGSIIAGLGIGLVSSQIINLILSTVPDKQVSEATGINATFEQLGNSIGVALVGALMMSAMYSQLADEIVQHPDIVPQIKNMATVEYLQANVTKANKQQITDAIATFDPSVQAALTSSFHLAAISSFDAAVAFMAFMIAIALVMSYKLPSKKLT